MRAAGGLASAEYLDAVLGDEQRQRHGAGRRQPAAPGRPGRVDVQVQGDALVLDQPRLGGAGEQLVEQDGHLPLALAGAEHCAECVPGLACVGQVAVVDFDPAGFIMSEQQLTQLARGGQQVFLPHGRRRIDQRYRQPGPPGRPEPNVRSHDCYGIRHGTRYR